MDLSRVNTTAKCFGQVTISSTTQHGVLMEHALRLLTWFMGVDCTAIVGGNASKEGSIEASECPELCSSSPCNDNSYCHCGMPSTCKWNYGFSGPDCSVDLCSSANCGLHGSCVTKHLGVERDVTIHPSLAYFFSCVVWFYILSYNGGYRQPRLKRQYLKGLSHTAVRFTIHIRSTRSQRRYVGNSCAVHSLGQSTSLGRDLASIAVICPQKLSLYCQVRRVY